MAHIDRSTSARSSSSLLAALALTMTLVVSLTFGGAADVVDAQTSEGDRPVLAPISPCRLADTRATFQVGPRGTPLTAGETVVFDAHGTNGDCSIPSTAVALSLNVTAVGPSAPTFLTVWPDGDRPAASSLNPVPGSPPTPNAVVTALADDGSFRIFNLAGTVDAIVDVNGYYEAHAHDDRYDTSTEVDAKIAAATAGIPGAGTSYSKTESDDRYYERSVADDRYYERSVADGRFYEGDDVVLVPADGTPSENGQALRDALAAITDADADDPHLIRLGAGVFDLGATPLAMLDHVSIEGASTTSTVLRSTGLTNTFTEDNATVMLADDVTLSDLTIENTGGASTAARGLLGSGADFLVHDVRLVVVANGAQVAVAFEGADISGGPDSSGVLRDVDAHVSAGTAASPQTGGFGTSNAFSGDMTSLRILDSTVELTTPGVGLGQLNGECCSSVLEIRDTTVRLTAGGTGAGSTGFDTMIYDGVDIQVSGGSSTNYGFFGAGSGFQPQIRNSTIDVTGTGSTAIRYNNGLPVVTNSTLRATLIGIDANANGPFGGFAFVENSVVDAFTAIRTTTTGTQQLRIGGTMLDASNLLDVTSGSVDARCADVHTDDHEPVSADCSGLAPSPLGDRTILVPGGGTDSQNGNELAAAITQVTSASPSDGDEWVIRLEPGSYQLSSGVTLPPFARIEGAGQEETEVYCTFCTVFTAGSSSPVTIVDLTVRSGTTGFVTVFGTDVRLERVHVQAPAAFGDGVDITGGDAHLIDVTVTTNATSVASALESDVNSIVIEDSTFVHARGRWQHLGGDAELRSSRTGQIIVGASNGTLDITDSTIDTRVPSGANPFGIADGTNTGTVTVELRHSRVFTSSTSAIDLDTGPSTLVLEHVVIDREASGFTPVDADTITMNHVTIDGPITSSVTETCLATARTDTNVFLTTTCP